MKFAVIGAGAIGAYVGAALARGGTDVVLVARGPHLEAMRRHGVRVISPLGDFASHPAATDSLEVMSAADVVFVALKANSLPALAPHIGSLLKSGTPTIWAQNGLPWWYFQSHPGPMENSTVESVDPHGVISRSIRAESVIGCVVYCSTEIVQPGVIRHVEGTRFTIGTPSGAPTPHCQQISEAFASAGLKAPFDSRIRNQIWLKLIGNVAFNPITALTGATLGQLGGPPEMIEVLRAIFSECAAVANALGVDLPMSLDRRLQAGLAVGDHKTSMLQDLEAGKALELDCLSGAVIELAGRLGVDVPHVHTVHACAKLLAELAAPSRSLPC